jgi:hypothetical protein
VALAASFVGQWGFNDFAYFDGFAYFLLLLIGWTRNPVAIAVMLVAAGFIDERAIIAAPIVYLLQDKSAGSSLPKWTLAPNGPRVATIAGVAVFLGLRVVLGLHLGAMTDTSGIAGHNGLVNLNLLRNNAIVLPLALLLLFKGLTILIGTSAVVLAMRKASVYAALVILAVLPCILAAVAVYDLSRSLGYAFLLIFISARILAKNLDLTSLRRIALCAAVVSVSMPSYYILLGLFPMLPIFRML